MNTDTLSRIAKAHGLLARLLARQRELLGHLDALNTVTNPTVQATIHIPGVKQISTQISTVEMRCNLEAELAGVEREILSIGNVPLGWPPEAERYAAVPAHLTGLPHFSTPPAPPPAPPSSDAPATTEGGPTHG
jgi:hypothetical protein